MPTRKVQDDPAARDVAGEEIDKAIGRSALAEGALSIRDDRETAIRAVLNAFPYVETETATAKVAGETVTMTRLVLTSGWTVDQK